MQLRNTALRAPRQLGRGRVGVCLLLCGKRHSPQSDQQRTQQFNTGLEETATFLVMEDIRKAISEAERELEAAEKAVASKRNALMASSILFRC